MRIYLAVELGKVRGKGGLRRCPQQSWPWESTKLPGTILGLQGLYEFVLYPTFFFSKFMAIVIVGELKLKLSLQLC